VNQATTLPKDTSLHTPLTPGAAARCEFPFFSEGPAGAYLDSAATSQKPAQVLDCLRHTMVHLNANVHRGAYRISAEATEAYDGARRKIARYLNAASDSSIVFTRGATESINLVAYGLEHTFKAGDVILLSLLEHHSNIVPWMMLAKRKGMKVVFTEISDSGELDLADYKRKVAELKPALVSITQLANSLGTVTPIAEVVSIAKQHGARVLVDGAQGVVHLGVDVVSLGCDYYVFSGHKMYGPTGIGVLYGAPEALAVLKPFQGGGDMISYVSTDGFGVADIPQRFEAGTPAFHEAIALGAAVDFLNRFNRQEMTQHEQHLVSEGIAMLKGEEGVTVYGPGAHSSSSSSHNQTSLVTFSIDRVHPHDFATIADTFNVQVRAGNHCAMPTLRRLGVQATARMSFGVYTVPSDLDAVRGAIREARKLFA
jgi:cysteine desulfurase/selenocysteine lyase